MTGASKEEVQELINYRKVRIETKLIKQILKTEFPDAIFKVKTIRPYSYVNSSDKVIIEPIYKAGKTTEDIMRIIKKYVAKISIGRYGNILSIGNEINPQIFDVRNNQWINVETEFILIK